jgi:hypothetical protein
MDSVKKNSKLNLLCIAVYWLSQWRSELMQLALAVGNGQEMPTKRPN